MPYNEIEEMKKQEFNDYLEQSGVLERITEVLLMLFEEPEKSSDPVDYFRRNLYPDNPDERELTRIRSLIEDASAKLVELKGVRDQLRAKLEHLEDEKSAAAAKTETETEDEGPVLDDVKAE